MTHDEFFLPLVREFGISPKHPVVKYLSRKTIAVDRGSKARRSLGNLYAMQVLAEDYVAGQKEGTQFTTLLSRMKEKPFGSKLQNHPLDNRLNDEFRRQLNLDGDLLPVQSGHSSSGKTRKISEKLLSYGESDPHRVSQFIVRVINEFSSIISSGQDEFIQKIQSFSSKDEISEFIYETFSPSSDARLFEVVSYCILKQHYFEKTVKFTNEEGVISEEKLTLFKTGRTNANDGGIDFVLKPLGRFFQVTETLDFKKYFLDFDKLNRVPITFVIKTDQSSEQVLHLISNKSRSEYEPDLHSSYMDLFEEVITNNELKEIFDKIKNSEMMLREFVDDLTVNFKVEYGHFD